MLFRRYVPLAFLVLLVSAGWVRERSINQPCDDVPCAHYNARLRVIESQIAQRAGQPVYLAIGDSITESADLPTLCGRQPINAGIGWATARSFAKPMHAFVSAARPAFVVIALGTNDVDLDASGHSDRIRHLIDVAAAPVILVPAPGATTAAYNAAVARFDTAHAAHIADPSTTDGLHLDAAAYVRWRQNLMDASIPICARLKSS